MSLIRLASLARWLAGLALSAAGALYLTTFWAKLPDPAAVRLTIGVVALCAAMSLLAVGCAWGLEWFPRRELEFLVHHVDERRNTAVARLWVETIEASLGGASSLFDLLGHGQALRLQLLRVRIPRMRFWAEERLLVLVAVIAPVAAALWPALADAVMAPDPQRPLKAAVLAATLVISTLGAVLAEIRFGRLAALLQPPPELLIDIAPEILRRLEDLLTKVLRYQAFTQRPPLAPA